MNKLNLQGSKTAENLAKSFVGESQARNRYTFYAETAEEEGYPTISEVFLMSADNERGHAEMFYDYLTQGLGSTVLTPQIMVPIDKGSTADNLYYAAKGEYEEWSDLYPGFGKTASEEGFEAIAKSFFSVAEVENRHDMRFRDLEKRLKSGMLYKSNEDVIWECINCGYRHKGKEAPGICPACRHAQKYFKIV